MKWGSPKADDGTERLRECYSDSVCVIGTRMRGLNPKRFADVIHRWSRVRSSVNRCKLQGGNAILISDYAAVVALPPLDPFASS